MLVKRLTKMSRNNVEVLKGLKLMLKALSLYDINGLCIGRIRIPNPIIILFISSTLILHFGLTIWFCIEFELNLKIISGAVSIASGTLQVQLIYIYLASYGDLVPNTVDELQKLVQRSKCLKPSVDEIIFDCLVKQRQCLVNTVYLSFVANRFFLYYFISIITKTRMLTVNGCLGNLQKDRNLECKTCEKTLHFCCYCQHWILYYNRIDANIIHIIQCTRSKSMDFTITSKVIVFRF